MKRFAVMYNDFILVGPKSDPAYVGGMKNVAGALHKIKDANAPFISRGDRSGTHTAELKLWQDAGIDVQKDHSIADPQRLGSVRVSLLWTDHMGSTAPDQSSGCYVRKTPDRVHPVPTTRFLCSADLDRIGCKSFGSAVAWTNFRTSGRSNA